MTNQSWIVDPATGDYVMSGGKPVIDDGLRTPAYIRLKTHRTKWMYAPDVNFGSDYYAAKIKHGPNSFRIVEGIAQRALQPLIDDGRATQISVETTEETRNNTALAIKITDASGQTEEVTFDPIGR